MSWLPSVQGFLVSLFVMSLIRAVWIWRRFQDHRFLRFVGWPGPFEKSGPKEYFFSSGVSRAEVERALSPEYARKYGWLMTARARRMIILANVIAWAAVVYGGFDLPGGLSNQNSHLSLWGIMSILTWWAARASARVIADAPDELLDERLLAMRNAAYHEAYRLLSVIVSFIVVVAITMDISISDSTRSFGSADWTSLTETLPYVAIWAVSSLPSLVLIARQSSEEN